MKPMRLEKILEKLINNGNPSVVSGYAGAFQSILDDNKCEKLAKLLEKLLKDKKRTNSKTKK